jgi:hypothetical protein
MPPGTVEASPASPTYEMHVIEEKIMRYVVLTLGLLVLPVTAFAQMFEGPTGTIPTEKCVRTLTGVVCSAPVDGSAQTSSQGLVPQAR